MIIFRNRSTQNDSIPKSPLTITLTHLLFLHKDFFPNITQTIASFF